MSIEIQKALAAVDTAETTLREAVQAARKAGTTWEAIGALFGVSGGSAHHRFGLSKGAATVEESRQIRNQAARIARKSTLAYKAAGSERDLGLTAAAAAKALNLDARTVKNMGPSARDQVAALGVMMPSGRFAVRYFLK
ncbi:hypothetical protein [Paeniglutamicibacter sp.]|uniref:hypothetical protein n=1 Tax=Paeniglutamicibacter sp. TaxID=1934391 RepID=UPI003988A7D0